MAYTTLLEIAALPSVDYDFVDDATINTAIDYATDLVDDYCGTYFEPTALTLVLDGSNTLELFVGVPHLRSVTACTIGGVSQTITGWKTYDFGVVRSDTNTFATSTAGKNIAITVQAGHASIPADMKIAVQTIASDYITRIHSGAVSDRTLSITNEYGSTRFATVGNQYPTGIPFCDAILNRYKVAPVLPNEVH